MDRPIEISAIIPVYNRKKTIARALGSVLAQEYPVAEIMVVDEESTDNTGDVVERYGDKACYTYQGNAGAAAARNQGVHEARYVIDGKVISK